MKKQLPNDYILSPKEALDIILLRTSTVKKIDSVYKLVYRKKGLAVKTPDGIRISMSGLNKYLESKPIKKRDW